jgi:hypothetical protein
MSATTCALPDPAAAVWAAAAAVWAAAAAVWATAAAVWAAAAAGAAQWSVQSAPTSFYPPAVPADQAQWILTSTAGPAFTTVGPEIRMWGGGGGGAVGIIRINTVSNYVAEGMLSPDFTTGMCTNGSLKLITAP